MPRPRTRINRRRPLAILAALGLGVAATLTATSTGTGSTAAATTTSRALGVNRSGTEYACAQGYGIFDGPSDAASIQAMASWHINTVRVPLNEDCWLGINGVNAAYSGANYQNAVAGYVSRLNAAGLTAILDLHWNAPGTTLATGQQDAPDQDHSPAFWSSVASTFKTVPNVAFDLYNEPHDISWTCWRDGCADRGGWQVAGMKQLVDSVRGAGATQQQIIATGLAYGNDLSQWLTYRPADSANHLAAGFHVYNFNSCTTTGCWDSTVAPVAAQVPVVTGEIGENDCAHGFIDSYMNWADTHQVGYLGWSWNTANCGNGPALITAYDGTPTAYGTGLRDHLAALASTPPPPAPASVRYSFEDGTTQGWAAEWGNITTANTTLVATDGNRALQASLVSNYDAIGTRTGLTGLVSGTTVTAKIYQPAGAPTLAVEPFVEDSTYTVHKTATATLTTGWNTVTFTVPTIDTATVLGFQVDDSTNWKGQIALDEIRW